MIGAVFYLMERRRGVVLRSSIPPEFAVLPDYARRLSQAFVHCLVDLHGVDVEAHGLVALGKPEGFIERQVRGWADRWRRAQTEEKPEMEAVVRYLETHIPAEGQPALVHNDFKLDNLMFRPGNPDQVEAVLDWEMATVGDPLVDLGLTLCYWDPPDAEIVAGPVPCLTRGPGWYTRQQLIEAYAQRTGRNLEALPFHEILGMFKLAVIIQQIYYRWFKGQTRDERFAQFHLRVDSLVRAAWERVQQLA